MAPKRKTKKSPKYSMDPRVTKLLSRNKKSGHTEVLGMCLPLLVFVVLAVLGYFMSWRQSRKQGREMSWADIATSLLVNVLIGYLVYELCKRGHVGWAWFVVFITNFLLPLLFMVLVLGLFIGGRRSPSN